jgi:hypothetical protein
MLYYFVTAKIWLPSALWDFNGWMQTVYIWFSLFYLSTFLKAIVAKDAKIRVETFEVSS